MKTIFIINPAAGPKDSSTSLKALIENIFKDKKINDSITIVDSEHLQKNCTVNITIVYELHHSVSGMLNDSCTNWRINKTFTVTYEE